MIWSPVGDLKWTHARKSSNIWQQKKFCMKSDPNFLRAVPEHLLMTGWSYFAQKIQHLFHRGDFKDDKMFANPNVSKKANRCLVMHFCPTWFWTCPGTSSLQAAPNCWAGDRCFYCGGAVADWADWKANVNGFAESSRHSAHTNSIRGHKPGIRVSAQLISIWAIITLFTFLFTRRNKNVQEVHKQEKLYLVWP